MGRGGQWECSWDGVEEAIHGTPQREANSILAPAGAAGGAPQPGTRPGPMGPLPFCSLAIQAAHWNSPAIWSLATPSWSIRPHRRESSSYRAPATAPRPCRCSRGGTPASKGLNGRWSQQRKPPTNEARARDSAPMPSPWRSTLTSQTKSAASLPEHARHKLRGWHRLHRQRVAGFHEKTGPSRRAARRTSQSGSISPCSDGPLMPASLADVKRRPMVRLRRAIAHLSARSQ